MKIPILFTLILLLTSCSMPMSIDSFEKEIRKNSTSSSTLSENKWVNQILYSGYEGDYHYFYIDPGLGFPKKIKVLRDELELHHEYPFTDDQSAWLLYSDVK